jgi:beta-galactosidase
VILDSGEVHYARLPDPRGWHEVLARLKAAGLDAISIYVPWSYHEPAPGVHRWSGRYDLERFLREARDAHLYVVVRHGPYVQGEMDGGGFPGWVLGRPGALRTNDPVFAREWKAWDADVLPRVARWQAGGKRRGTVIGLQIENEYPGDGAGPEAYMRAQYDEARKLGIRVPILHNDQQVAGTLPAPGRFGDLVDLYGWDNYPYGFSCCPEWNTKTFSQLDGTEQRYRTRGATRSPLYTPEIQGGMAPISGPDGKTPDQRSRALDGYSTVQTLTLIGQGTTMLNQYMTFGGTTWGYTPFPNQGTSYDYAAPIRESTVLGNRWDELRRTSLQLAVAPRSLANTVRDDAAVKSSDASALYAVRRSQADRALHVILRNADPGPAKRPRLTFGADTTPPVPVPGHGARYLLARARVKGWRIDWSSAEVLLATRRTLVLFGDRGKPYAARIAGRRLRVTPGAPRLRRFGSRRILVVTRGDASRTWLRGRTIYVGPQLVTPHRILTTRATRARVIRDGRMRTVRLRGAPRRVKLPALRGWRFKAESPEREPGYDDAGWRKATRTTTDNQVQPLTSPILFADENAVPTGYAWYRGRFTGPAAGLCVEGRHRYHVWVNGRSLGTVTSDAEAPGPSGFGGLGALPPRPQAVHLKFPAGSTHAGTNVVSVLTESWGHTMDAVASNQAKQPRGLWSAALDRGLGARCGWVPSGESVTFGQLLKPGTPLPVRPDGGIAWRIRGGRRTDYPNASGLYGERAGWYRDHVKAAGWTKVALPDRGRLGDGQVGWYRSSFRVRLPKGVRAPLGIAWKGAAPAELWVNGVHVARIGRDDATRFVLPAGLVRLGGRRNTIALARWAIDGAAVGRPRLFAYGTERAVRAP